MPRVQKVSKYILLRPLDSTLLFWNFEQKVEKFTKIDIY